MGVGLVCVSPRYIVQVESIIKRSTSSSRSAFRRNARRAMRKGYEVKTRARIHTLTHLCSRAHGQRAQHTRTHIQTLPCLTSTHRLIRKEREAAPPWLADETPTNDYQSEKPTPKAAWGVPSVVVHQPTAGSTSPSMSSTGSPRSSRLSVSSSDAPVQPEASGDLHDSPAGR